MFIVMIRTLILYSLVLITMRIMGKKQVGQLEPFELVITIMISELASLPMQDTKLPLIYGIIPIVTLLILQVLISIFEMKSKKIQHILTGKPTILIKDGELQIDNLWKEKYTVNDLLEEIRLKDYHNLTDIQYAILETNGQISIIPKTEESPVTKSDLDVESDQEELPATLVIDGKIIYENLNSINKDELWLKQMLKENNIESIEDTFVALLDSKGTFFCQSRKDGEK